MVTVGMNYQVVPGREMDFERVFQGVVKALSGAPEHVSTRLFRACEMAADYLIVSEWSNREAFEGFIHSDAFRRVTSWSLDGVLRGRPTHEVYEHRGDGDRSPADGASTGGQCPVAHGR